MKNILTGLLLLFTLSTTMAQVDQVSVEYTDDGIKLIVNDNDFLIKGVNWDYFPIGTNYAYNLWSQPDNIIKAALDIEMPLLKNMKVNAIRQYTGVPPKWITYIYKKYGIFTMLNHPFGRYGVELNGVWIKHTEYSDSNVKKTLLSEVKTLAETYKNTPGLLMYLLGNENNYGLFWKGAETEDFPTEDRHSTTHARQMYQLFNEAALAIKGIDSAHPIAMCNGDLAFLEIIAKECDDVDIFGVNMYRGISFGDAFQSVKETLNKPILFTEFGTDAFNVLENREDQFSQAYYLVGNWLEIYENAAGFGKAGNSIGGFTFQFSDSWWKYGQTKNLNIHDKNASWSNGGYKSDFKKGENNMNEEWFGICAKGETNERGLYLLYPRAAYYALREVHQLNPMDDNITLESIREHFSAIQINDAVVEAQGDKVSPRNPLYAHDQSDVISVFSDVYSNITNTDFHPNWGQTTVVTEVQIEGNNTLLYTGLNYQGIQFDSQQDVSGMKYLHIDFYSANSSILNTFLISSASVTRAYTLSVPTSGWNSIDIPLSDFSPVDLTKVIQLKFEGKGDIYLDNIYFWN